MKNMKFLALLLALVMAISVLASCGPKNNDNGNATQKEEGNNENTENKGEEAGTDVPDEDNYVNTFDDSQPNTLDPSRGSDRYGNNVIMNVLEPLVRIEDVPGKLGEVRYVGAGAEDWKISDDGLTYTFNIREGNKWNDGTPVVAGDYEFGIKRSADPKTACPYANMIYYLKNGEEVNTADPDSVDLDLLGVSAPDDKTLVMELKAPCPYFIDLVTQRVFMPQRKDLVEQYGDTYSTTPETTPQCGPFILHDWIMNSEQNYVRNDNYWDAANIKLDRWKLRIISDSNTIYNALKTGEIDFAGVADPKWKGQFLNDPNFTFIQADRPFTGYLMPNCNKGKITSNAKIRQALAIALNRQELIDSTMNGVPIPAFDFVPPSVSCGSEPFNTKGEGNISKLIEENPDPKALFIEGLKELGMDEDPAKATVHFIGSGTSQDNRLMTEFIQQNLEEKLGCTLEVDNQDWNQFINLVMSGDYDVSWLGWSADFNDPSNFLETCYSPTAAYPTGYKNPDFDALIEKAQKELDNSKRIEILKEAEKVLIHDDAAIIPINHAVANIFRRTYIKNANYSPFTTTGFRNVYTSGRK